MNVTCPDDGVTAVEMAVNIDSIKVKKTKGHNSIIKLDDKYSMKLKYPSMKQFIENNFDVEETNVNQSLSMLSGCIDMVYDCLLYTSPSPRDRTRSRMPSSA